MTWPLPSEELPNVDVAIRSYSMAFAIMKDRAAILAPVARDMQDEGD